MTALCAIEWTLYFDTVNSDFSELNRSVCLLWKNRILPPALLFPYFWYFYFSLVLYLTKYFFFTAYGKILFNPLISESFSNTAVITDVVWCIYGLSVLKRVQKQGENLVFCSSPTLIYPKISHCTMILQYCATRISISNLQGMSNKFKFPDYYLDLSTQ